MAAYYQDYNQSQSNQSNVKTIILLGKTGSGKSTLASHIFNDATGFPIHGSVDSTTRAATMFVHDRVHTLEGQNIRVVIMDISGLDGTNYSMWQVLQQIEALGQVCAIFFVLRFGRVTPEDSAPINVLISGLQNHSDISYLVITGCEGKNKANRDGLIDMYSNDPVTYGICSFVKRHKIIPVGFPDINKMASSELRSLYEEETREDEIVVQRIAKSAQSRRISIVEPWWRRLWSTVRECTIL